MHPADHFLIASALIQEGSRTEAATHLRAALRALKRSARPDNGLRADLEQLLANVERNARRAA